MFSEKEVMVKIKTRPGLPGQKSDQPDYLYKAIPIHITMRLFIVARIPTDSIICFVKAHLYLDPFITGAI